MMSVRMFAHKIFRIVLDDGRFFLMTADTRIENSFKKRIFSLKKPWEPYFSEIQMYRLPSNHSHSGQMDPGFEFPTSQNPLEPHFSEIPVYRLPSNHCRPRETDLGFELPASIYP